MASRWFIITLSAIIIASSLVIGITYFLLKKSDEEEQIADEIYLRSKTSMLKSAVDKNLQATDGIVNTQSGKLLASVNSSQKTVKQSTSRLAGLISRQKAAIESLKKRFNSEKSKLQKRKD